VATAAAALTQADGRQLTVRVPVRQALQTLCAYVFVTNSKGLQTALFIYNDLLVRLDYPLDGAYNALYLGQNTLDFQANEQGELGSVNANGSQYSDMRPPELAATFVRVARQMPWIAVSVDPRLEARQLDAVPAVSGEGAGAQALGSTEDVRQGLRALTSLRNDGLITEEEYGGRRAALLDTLLARTAPGAPASPAPAGPGASSTDGRDAAS